MRMRKTENGECFSRIRYVDFEDDVLLHEYNTKIRAARLRGLLQINEEEHIWILQEKNHLDGEPLDKKKTIRFASFDRSEYEKYLGRRLPYERFISYLEKFAITNYDINEYETISEKISGLIRDIQDRSFFTKQIPFTDSTRRRTFNDFCRYLPIDIDEYVETIEETRIEGEKKITRPRVLCELISYYTVYEEIIEFWHNASERDKLYFFPFYLYMAIAGIIPMRPIEFCKTPYYCLNYKKEEITFLRTFGENKGHDISKVFNHDQRDWQHENVTIPDSLIEDIEWFNKYRSKYTGGSFLFTTNLAADNHPTGKKVNLSDIFDPDALKNIKNQFYKQILLKRKGYRLISDTRKAHYQIDYGVPDNKEIEVINLGDVRHIAIINLLRQGCSVQALKTICHHQSVEISLHYGNNIDLFEKAATFVFFAKYRKTFVEKMKYSRKDAIVPQKRIPQYKSKGVITYENVIKEMEIGRDNGVDMGNVICISPKIIRSVSELKNNTGKYVLDTTDCRPEFLKHPTDPCLKCQHSIPKKESVKTIDAIVWKKLVIGYETIIKTIPMVSGGSFADIGAEICDMLGNLSDMTNIQRINEVKKYYAEHRNSR